MNWRLGENVRFLVGVCSVASAALGGAAGYVVSTKILEKKFQERLTAEMQDAKSYYQDLYSTPTFVQDNYTVEVKVPDAEEDDPVPSDLVAKAIGALRDYQGEDHEEKEEKGRIHREPVIINNIFTNATPPGEEVLGALLADRDPSAPYIITKEEFLQNEPDFEQAQFTYWEGDGILVDDREEMDPIQNTDMVAGDDNLLRFGYGSGDENVLYVRNETLDPPIDLHITRSSGKYSVEVMAFLDDDEPHLEHSQRRFRLHDE